MGFLINVWIPVQVQSYDVSGVSMVFLSRDHMQMRRTYNQPQSKKGMLLSF